MARIIDLSIFERPREKAKLLGIEQLSTTELLAIIISSGSKSESALEIANTILNDNCGLENISKMSYGQFKQYKGIGDSKALKLTAVFELCERTKEAELIDKKKRLDNNFIANLVKNKIGNEISEKLVVISIYRKSIIQEKVISIGNEDTLISSPSLIINSVLSCGCNTFYIAHNHPSNNAFPSNNDISFTIELLSLCERLKIKLLDHLIICDSCYYSFFEKCLKDY